MINLWRVDQFYIGFYFLHFLFSFLHPQITKRQLCPSVSTPSLPCAGSPGLHPKKLHRQFQSININTSTPPLVSLAFSSLQFSLPITTLRSLLSIVAINAGTLAPFFDYPARRQAPSPISLFLEPPKMETRKSGGWWYRSKGGDRRRGKVVVVERAE